MSKRKPILCLDFDGVIHSYTSGWSGAAIISDPPVRGALDFLVVAHKHFNVQIYSSRSSQPGGIEAMQEWLQYCLEEHAPEINVIELVYKHIKWPISKPPAMVTIDDRALTFNGTWPPISDLLNFKPWNK